MDQDLASATSEEKGNHLACANVAINPSCGRIITR